MDKCVSHAHMKSLIAYNHNLKHQPRVNMRSNHKAAKMCYVLHYWCNTIADHQPHILKLCYCILHTTTTPLCTLHALLIMMFHPTPIRFRKSTLKCTGTNAKLIKLATGHIRHDASSVGHSATCTLCTPVLAALPKPCPDAIALIAANANKKPPLRNACVCGLAQQQQQQQQKCMILSVHAVRALTK
eukprot:18364-Heterococcus_DN1.PRE.4